MTHALRPGCWKACWRWAQASRLPFLPIAPRPTPPSATRHVVILLGVLWKTGAQDQVTTLLRRDPAARVPLDDPSAVAALLKILLKAGAHDQITTLLRRDPAARVSLDDPRPSVWPPPLKSLLESLQEAGAREQAAALADRLPGAGMFWPLPRPRRSSQPIPVWPGD